MFSFSFPDTKKYQQLTNKIYAKRLELHKVYVDVHGVGLDYKLPEIGITAKEALERIHEMGRLFRLIDEQYKND